MTLPADSALYEKVKKRVYALYKAHSAYRSGFLVKEYKKAFTRNTAQENSLIKASNQTQRVD